MTEDTMTLSLRGQKLKNVDGFLGKNGSSYSIVNKVDSWFGKSDPFFQVYDHRYRRVAQSKIIHDNLNPEWPAVILPLQKLCEGDYDKVFHITFYDWEQDQHHQFMGHVSTTVNQILSSVEEKESRLSRLALRRKKNSTPSFSLLVDGIDYGTIFVTGAQIVRQHVGSEAHPPDEFIETSKVKVLKGGKQVDFTAQDIQTEMLGFEVAYKPETHTSRSIDFGATALAAAETKVPAVDGAAKGVAVDDAAHTKEASEGKEEESTSTKRDTKTTPEAELAAKRAADDEAATLEAAAMKAAEDATAKIATEEAVTKNAAEEGAAAEAREVAQEAAAAMRIAEETTAGEASEEQAKKQAAVSGAVAIEAVGKKETEEDEPVGQTGDTIGKEAQIPETEMDDDDQLLDDLLTGDEDVVFDNEGSIDDDNDVAISPTPQSLTGGPKTTPGPAPPKQVPDYVAKLKGVTLDSVHQTEEDVAEPVLLDGAAPVATDETETKKETTGKSRTSKITAPSSTKVRPKSSSGPPTKSIGTNPKSIVDMSRGNIPAPSKRTIKGGTNGDQSSASSKKTTSNLKEPTRSLPNRAWLSDRTNRRTTYSGSSSFLKSTSSSRLRTTPQSNNTVAARSSSVSKPASARSQPTQSSQRKPFNPVINSPLKFNLEGGDVFERLYRKDTKCYRASRVNKEYFSGTKQ